MNRPLPESLRPADLEHFVGQPHLRAQIQALLDAPHLPSLLLFGPPGCGKSTLALLLARASGKKMLRLSAPEAGIQQLRRQLSILESGEMTMIATTTENPSFSVTRQLLSRLHVLRLKPLGRDDLLSLARRGTEKTGAVFPDEVLEFLAALSNGDARTLLNLVEYVSGLPEDQRTLAGVQKVMPEMVARHDKDGDSHYELASAMIKSIRGSDPDAALYYLACLLEGGEDPRFICRRLILSASEDVGLADPHALPMAVACQQAVEFVGMPEGYIPLAETTVYLALAPKSNSTYAAYHNVTREIKNNGMQPVPLHLRNAVTKMQKQWGYGRDYQYPHNFPGAWVDQEYLPETVVARRYYQCKDQGDEPRLNAWHRRHRRAAPIEKK